MLFSQISACLKSAQMRHRVTVYNGACILLVQISTRTRGQIPTDRRTQTDRQISPKDHGTTAHTQPNRTPRTRLSPRRALRLARAPPARARPRPLCRSAHRPRAGAAAPSRTRPLGSVALRENGTAATHPRRAALQGRLTIARARPVIIPEDMHAMMMSIIFLLRVCLFSSVVARWDGWRIRYLHVWPNSCHHNFYVLFLAKW